jgi:hypothetical protein
MSLKIFAGVVIVLLQAAALTCTLKAYAKTSDYGRFISTLFLGGMAGKERFTSAGWKWRNRAVLLQWLTVLTLILYILSRE